MLIKNIIQILEEVAPPSYQESYDNSGLIVGDAGWECSGAIICLDTLESVVEEAKKKGANLIIAHHPIVFKGLKKINGNNYVERVIINAIKNDIAIYAIHTNLDNVLHHGVNTMICNKLNLKNSKILVPKSNILKKITAFVPQEATSKVIEALHKAGAGQIGQYKDCSFQTNGIGKFMPTGDANPNIGSLNNPESVNENRIELIFETYRESKIIAALKEAHPYEEVAYYIHTLDNSNNEVGSGMIGELETAMITDRFLEYLKAKMNVKMIRHTALCKQTILKVAVCGGSGSFLLSNAIKQKADIYITADFKYHEFFDADNQIIIADIGHYESEQFTKELIFDILSKKITNFAFHLSEVNTNPVNYL
jgi:dinuclear metal center YbgI/SA1388 family protein